jgi:catechol 1,2-dioxygenase
MSNDLKRREFLKSASLMVMAISMPVIGCSSKDDIGPLNNCETTADILGPYYKAGSPIRQLIIPENNGTPPLVITGKVFSGCEQVLENAIVEIWNADENGDYDLSETFFFRGSNKTGSDGTYKFTTIVPGRYLNGATYRPSHIHFRITAPDHQELVSQIYFAEDPFIDDDPWASDPKAQERILVMQKGEDDTDTVNFDIYLNRI